MQVWDWAAAGAAGIWRSAHGHLSWSRLEAGPAVGARGRGSAAGISGPQGEGLAVLWGRVVQVLRGPW
jgi:hypothetical protein